MMYSAVTQDIRVTVRPEYSEQRSQPDAGQYFWLYTIEIQNQSLASVQLTHRYWRITDGNGKLEEVRGPGVVGEQPTLAPGTSFRYTSGCPLTTPSGIMVGSYRMVDTNGQSFEIAIPAFSLDCPHGRRIVN